MSEATHTHPARLKFPRKTVVVSAIALIILVAAGSGSAFVWAQQYEGRIAPHVSIGHVDVSGLDPETARMKVRSEVDRMLASGITVIFGGSQSTLPLSASGTDAVEIADFDVDAAIETALHTNRSINPALDTLQLIGRQFSSSNKVVPVPVELHRDAVLAATRELYPEAEAERRNAGFTFTRIGARWDATALASRPGRVFYERPYFADLESRLGLLDSEHAVSLELAVSPPDVTDADAEALVPAAKKAVEHAPISVNERPDGSGHSWIISAQTLSTLLRPERTTEGDGPRLGIDPDAWNTYLDLTITPDVEVKAQNARFRIEKNRVVEFADSKAGVSLDRETMRQDLINLLENGSGTLVLVTQTTEPEITTGEVNDIGVTDLLGTGYSSYKGSPANRIKNIANGAKLLNGLLIPPDTTFSLVEALKPFTFENGYLSELVIKGDKIEPELGGGLCQIGTTTFRAAMNAGLPIAERRNHSLVVSYYNDPANGLPGTDATIYEPAPDLKFTNDTGHYVLFVAENNTTTQELFFHFWGTSDGRKGSYTPPVVLRWIPVGEPRRIESPTMEPGKETCQSAHVGADTSFTYTIVRPDGTEENTVFESHYRPLPKICLVGAAETPDASTTEPVLPEPLPADPIFE